MAKYYRPANLADALAALASASGSAYPLAGGTDLLVGLRHRRIEPSLIVDLKGITDLPDPIEVTDAVVRIGPTLTMAALIANPTVRQWYPALVEAALTVGSVAIRNRASLIGNSCNASPAADTAGALLVHDASAIIASHDGNRTVAMDDFFLGPRRTLCGPGELVIRIDLPRPAPGSSSAFQRLTRRRGVDLATVSVAASVDRDHRVTLGLGAVGPRPLRAEFEPRGCNLDDGAALTQALEVAAPISDIRGSRKYRLATVRVLAKRAIRTAAQRRHDRKEAS